MQADVSSFRTGQVGQPAGRGGPAVFVAATGPHHANAALRVAVVNAVSALVMAVPVATFAAAASRQPVFEDGAWHWRFSAQVQGVAFEANLEGRVIDSGSTWTMLLTSNATTPALVRFPWYEGTVLAGGGSGTWEIYDPATQDRQRSVLRIDWTHESDAVGTLVFTVTDEQRPEVGDSLTYDRNGDFITVRYQDVSTGEVTVIHWNRTTGAGSMTAPNYNGGSPACWDANLDDVPCGS